MSQMVKIVDDGNPRNARGFEDWDSMRRQQCKTCWKWQFPAIHSCPGVPQPGRIPPQSLRREPTMNTPELFAGAIAQIDTVVGAKSKMPHPSWPLVQAYISQLEKENANLHDIRTEAVEAFGKIEKLMLELKGKK